MPIRFTNPVMTYSRFELNPDFTDNGNGLQAKMNFNYATKRLEQDCAAAVAIRLQINQEEKDRSDNAPFWLEVEYTADFNWTNDMSDDEVERYLRINAPDVLISYIRPMVAAMTSASPFPTYNLPFVNVKDMFL